jgi:molybdopterin-containing oxidoreductase family iron-sulfur binding subunit
MSQDVSDVVSQEAASQAARSSRRGVLAAAASVFASFTLAPGVTLRAFAEQPVTRPGVRKKRWAILIDTTKCTPECDACVTACNTEFNLTSNGRPRTDPQWIRKVNITDKASGHVTSLPVMCQHCAEPPCVEVCPTGASFQRPDGIVLVDKHICIGCRYCIMACPYGARNFVSELVENQRPWGPRGKGTAEACTMCVHRVAAGRTPACVEACSTTGNKAMLFGDLNDPDSEIAKRVATFPTAQIRADLRTNPAVRYEGI